MDVKLLVDSYIQWLRNTISVKEINEFFEITTPFLDRNNDCMQIFLKNEGDDNYLLTDDGYIINDLLLLDFNLETPRRKKLLNQILNSYGVHKDKNNALTIYANKDNFPIKKHFLIQAMLSVSDMFMTSRSMVTTLFYEDVENYLYDNEVRFFSNIQFTGKSGYVHNFEFAIPPSKHGPERLIKAINSPNKENTTSNLFIWNDTKQTRKSESNLYVFLNDSGKSVSNDILNAYREYNIKPILWSNRNHAKVIEQLIS